MQSHIFRIVIEPDRMEDGTPAFHAHCPALKGCHTWGFSYNEALARAQEAIELYVEDLVACGEPVPNDEQVTSAVLPVPAVAVNV